VGTGELIAPVVPPLGQRVHGRAAGVADAQHPRHLVEALPRRVVPGSAQNRHVRVVPHVYQHGVSAGDAQADEGGLQLGVSDVVGGDVAPDMVHRDQRYPQSIGRRFGEVDPHQQRTDEAGGVGDRHGVDVRPGQPRPGQGLVGQAGDGLHVLAGGDLRHHAAVDGVHIRLGGNHIGQHGAAVPHHRRRSLVTRGFKGQDIHPNQSFLAGSSGTYQAAEKAGSASVLVCRNVDHPPEQRVRELAPIQAPVGILEPASSSGHTSMAYCTPKIRVW
jgi:hypothetical protein